MTVRTLTVIQSAWALIMGLAGTFLASVGNPVGFALIGIAMVYGYAIFSLYRLQRWAWWFCCALAAMSLFAFAPNVIHNFVRFATNDPLYQDSPATIFIVAINALVLVGPATIVLVILLTKRRLLSPNKPLERTRGEYSDKPK